MASLRIRARALYCARNRTGRNARQSLASCFNLRLDRIDRLNDGTFLVIDYKSGDVSPKSWDLPRPDDVQLPLYAGFALDRGPGARRPVFAKLRAGETLDSSAA